MSKRVVFCYSLLITLVCCCLTIVFACWGYWKTVYPMFILGIITSMPISSVFSSKGKVNWGDGIIASIHMLIFMVLLVFRINEKEYSPIATFGMFTLLGIVFITCGIVEDLKCRKI